MNSFEIKEKEWIQLELKDDDFDHPRVELSLSFDAEYFKIKAVVHDTHFKGGERSWRYGDGLFEAAIVGSGVIRYPWDEEHPETDLGRIRKGAKHIPYLVMHGTEDRAVPFKDAKEFVETLKREGFDVTFEVYEGAGHGNYDPSAAIVNWLMHYGL